MRLGQSEREYIARYSNVKWKHIRCKKEKDLKTETCLEPLLISGFGFVIGFYRMTMYRLCTGGLKYY